MNTEGIRSAILTMGLLAVLLAGCAPAAVTQPTATSLPPTQFPQPTLPVVSSTSGSASATPPPPSPIWTVEPTASQPSPLPATQASGEITIQIFLIALEDNGKGGKAVGCGDSVVPVNVTVPRTQAVLRAAYEELFSIKDQYYGESGLYNALYQSDLAVEELNIDANGKATVRLAGETRLGGVCDDPRFQAQLEETALQFSTVKTVEIFINGKPLEEIVSGRGG